MDVFVPVGRSPDRMRRRERDNVLAGVSDDSNHNGV